MSESMQPPMAEWPTREKLNWLCRRVGKIDNVLLGEHGRLGVVGKVDILWRTYVWVLCALSGGLGSLVTYLIMRR